MRSNTASPLSSQTIASPRNLLKYSHYCREMDSRLTICSPALSVTAIRSLAVHSGITQAINNEPGTDEQREIRSGKSRQVTRIKSKIRTRAPKRAV
jgi:hypothetical protein